MDHILPVLMKSMNLSYMSSGITGLGSSLRYFFKMFATECAVKLFSVVIVILPEKQFTGLSCQPKIMHKCFNMINTCITWWLTLNRQEGEEHAKVFSLEKSRQTHSMIYCLAYFSLSGANYRIQLQWNNEIIWNVKRLPHSLVRKVSTDNSNFMC